MSLSNTHSDLLNKVLADALEFACPKLIESQAKKSVHQSPDNAHDEALGHIMLTVSGLEFRAAVFLHYQCKEHAGSTYLKLHNSERSEPTERDWEPFYTEMGNHLCGRIKHCFHNQFEYLGMSTPWILSPTTHLVDLSSPQIIAFSQVFFSLDGSPLIGASLYVYSCQPLNFNTSIIESNESITTGELEFF
jgi:hypothetical protein